MVIPPSPDELDAIRRLREKRDWELAHPPPYYDIDIQPWHPYMSPDPAWIRRLFGEDFWYWQVQRGDNQSMIGYGKTKTFRGAKAQAEECCRTNGRSWWKQKPPRGVTYRVTLLDDPKAL